MTTKGSTLRESAERRAAERAPTIIDRLIADHPTSAEEIRDLLLGEPLLGSRIVAETLRDEFGIEIAMGAVQRWRQRNKETLS